MVRELIRREFTVSLSAVSVGRLLRTLGLSPQRPLWRAWQADPEAVQRWRDEEFPAIRAEAKKAGVTVYFADEAGIRSDYHAGTTWAPVGQTAVVKATGARHGLNMISAVTAQGLLRFSPFTGGFTAARFIEFCKKLLADTDPVYLVVDGHPAHRAKAVTEFVASTDGRLRLFVLPAYSPQLNPDEWVWKNVKHDRVGRTSVTGPEQFKAKVISALRRLQKMPAIVGAFFSDPDLRHITACSSPPTNDLLSKGHGFDLNALTHLFATGNPRAVQTNEGTFLEATESRSPAARRPSRRSSAWTADHVVPSNVCEHRYGRAGLDMITEIRPRLPCVRSLFDQLLVVGESGPLR
jgi:transposase